MFLFSLALSYRELGDYEGAIATGTQSLAMFRAADAELEAASIQNELALVYLALGSLDVARGHAAEAHAVFRRRDDLRWLAHVTETEGQIALAAGAPAEALERSRRRSRSPIVTATGRPRSARSSSRLVPTGNWGRSSRRGRPSSRRPPWPRSTAAGARRSSSSAS